MVLVQRCFLGQPPPQPHTPTLLSSLSLRKGEGHALCQVAALGQTCGAFTWRTEVVGRCVVNAIPLGTLLRLVLCRTLGGRPSGHRDPAVCGQLREQGES